MPSQIPPVLAPYIQTSLSQNSLTLLTSTLETPAHWLVLRYITAAIYGVDDDDTTTAPFRSRAGSENRVVFLSLVQSFDLWLELSKKISRDLNTHINSKKISYIDGLSPVVNAPPTSTTTSTTASGPKLIRLKSHSLADLSQAINNAKTSLFPQSTTTRTITNTTTVDKNDLDESNSLSSSPVVTTIILDGLDYILATQPNLTPTNLTTFIMNLRSQFEHVIVTLAGDAPLLHNIEPSTSSSSSFASTFTSGITTTPAPLELNHSIFIRTLAHQCTWIVQLRPLDSGFARDVSGVVRVSRGAGFDESQQEEGGRGRVGDGGIDDGEWLYQVRGDGSVKVWGRGE